MNRVTFTDPMGNLEENPSPELIKGAVFEKGNDFWQVGCALASIYFFESQNDKEKSYVFLAGTEEDGFMVQHKYKGDGEHRHTLRVGEHRGEVVEAMNSAGEIGHYYREYFVPKHTAWDAIEYFLQTGERKPDLTWEIAEYPERDV